LDKNAERIRSNRHFATVLRKRLESRHAQGTALRRALDQPSDTELVEQYLLHDRLLIEQLAKSEEGA
jgi:hypothetical protein